ncbi:acyl-CoA desaturase [Bordetella sp. FB-8]|uniref:acyl-CoA desaturase n=1 Tax=Bordetella sp. FB-8 TaxID=1159870 RepID=UPI0012DE7D6B|nr:acyl-CoA desaturase [Bordetella sp. FB-8]
MKNRCEAPAPQNRAATQAQASWTTPLRRWFDTQGADQYPAMDDASRDRIDWPRAIPFFLIHAGCLGVLWVGASPVAVATALTMYVMRMFFLTAFYHRYFSHRAFRTSRAAQFVFAILGASCVQRGPLWWAAHHRSHHAHADTHADLHSPVRRGFWRSHTGWFLTRRAFSTNWDRVPDLRSYPELRWLDRYDITVPLAVLASMYGLGAMLRWLAPGWGTSGMQMAVWGFCISTVAVYHATFCINSLAHQLGKARFHTGDDSRNNLWLALLTLGEGWHNNHHFYPGSARQGFRRREVDLTWYGLWLLGKTGLIWDLKPIPVWVLNKGKD